VDLGTAEGKYGLYTEDVDDCGVDCFATSVPVKSKTNLAGFGEN